MRVVTIVNQTRGDAIAERAEIADTSLTRMVGLLGRHGLDAGAGLWIKPSSGVHTFFMKFPIDVIGLDGEMRVIKLWHSIVPWRVTSVSVKMRSVIELPAGQIKACGVAVGDVLQLV